MTFAGVKPAVLAVVAPARACVTGEGYAVEDTARVHRAEQALRAQGWTLSECANMHCVHERFAGTDAQRAAGVSAAFADPDVDLIMALRGGYGTTRILPLLDWERIGASAAPLIGLSDITALSLALLAKCGKASWQGPTLSFFAQPDARRDAAFAQAMTQPDFVLRCPVTGPEGQWRGLLWGGNLTMITSLLGTEYFPQADGGILFIEDVATPAWRVERMLDQLANAGVLGRQQAVVVCDMNGSETACGEGAVRFGLDEALAYIGRKTGLPVIRGVPFGHLTSTLTLPVGVQAEAAVADGMLTLTAPDAPVPACVPWLETARHSLWWE